MSEAISETLIRQRVRNRLIEYFDFASSFENIARFGVFEFINRWNDWVDDDPNSPFFAEPVFSELEQAAIRRFHAIWDHCAEQQEEELFDAQALSELEHWCAFRLAAKSTLKLFEQRGRFPEDEEQF